MRTFTALFAVCALTLSATGGAHARSRGRSHATGATSLADQTGFFFPSSRGDRSTYARATATPQEDDLTPNFSMAQGEGGSDSDEAEANASLIKTLIESVLLKENVRTTEPEQPSQSAVKYLNTPLEESLILLGKQQQQLQQQVEEVVVIPEANIFEAVEATNEGDYFKKHAYERKALPRNVDGLSTFGAQMAAAGGLNGNADARFNALPQLAEFSDPEPVAMNLLDFQLRQADGSDDTVAPTLGDLPNSSDDEIRCIPKVMQVEETVYDRAIKCQHSYQEKCHMTYITDYRSTTEQKCETTFKKNCHITFKPMPFNETVNVCHTPVVRRCGNEPVGPEICSTHYETNCETTYKTYEIEQDEPRCEMVVMTKCDNVTFPFPTPGSGGDTTAISTESTVARQADGSVDVSTTAGVADDGTSAPPTELVTIDPLNQPQPNNPSGITLEQRCEEWPVQKCTLEKRTVKKVHPDTQCRKIPREVCVPNNCAMVQGDEICRDENRMQVQNVPEEECDLQPEEQCHMEAVLVPRLVPKPNCVKVPKEICVNTKKNPRRVKKPVVKEWCYRPKDILENPGVLPPGIFNPAPGSTNTAGTDTRRFF